MLPGELPYDGITFHLAPAHTGAPDAVVARGQTIQLPAGTFTRAYVLAASANGDRPVTFRAGDRVVTDTIQDWGGYVGQWDNRQWKTVEPTAEDTAAFERQRVRQDSLLRIRIDSVAHAGGDTMPLIAQSRRFRNNRGPRSHEEFNGLVPGFIKPASIAWYASHKHNADGVNQAYQYSYLFAYPIDLPAGAHTLTLPNDDAVRILAITVANEPGSAHPAAPLHDTLVRSSK
jgi:alpha-mannosidase